MTTTRLPFIKLTSIPPGATIEEIEAILATSHKATIAEWQALNVEPQSNIELSQVLEDLE